jgi:hypothetical protein|tara:strand:+ start:1395 stop:1919 length:525 start_codon:yes stop_codon:yes gene_type:complete
MKANKSSTFTYIVLSFIAPIIFAWVMSQTHWGQNPTSTSNKGLLVNSKEPWQIYNDAKKSSKWRVVVFSDNTHCQERLHHADASIILLRDDAKRVQLLTGDNCKITTQTPLNHDPSLSQLIQQAPKHFNISDSSEITMMIIDPLGYAVTLYTSSHPDQALMKDLKTLLKYSRIG